MVDTQKVRSAWLHKSDFCVEDWVRLLDIFDVDEDIRDRTFAIDVWERKPLRSRRERRVIDVSLD